MHIIWKTTGPESRFAYDTPNMVYMILEETFGNRAVRLTANEIRQLQAMANAANDNVYEDLIDLIQEKGEIIICPANDNEKPKS